MENIFSLKSTPIQPGIYYRLVSRLFSPKNTLIQPGIYYRLVSRLFSLKNTLIQPGIYYRLVSRLFSLKSTLIHPGIFYRSVGCLLYQQLNLRQSGVCLLLSSGLFAGFHRCLTLTLSLISVIRKYAVRPSLNSERIASAINLVKK